MTTVGYVLLLEHQKKKPRKREQKKEWWTKTSRFPTSSSANLNFSSFRSITECPAIPQTQDLIKPHGPMDFEMIRKIKQARKWPIRSLHVCGWLTYHMSVCCNYPMYAMPSISPILPQAFKCQGRSVKYFIIIYLSHPRTLWRDCQKNRWFDFRQRKGWLGNHLPILISQCSLIDYIAYVSICIRI